MCPTLTASRVQGYTVAIRMLLHDDNSASMTLFFGFVGALNAACLAPVLLGLQLAGLVDVLGMSARVLLLTITKGATAEGAGSTYVGCNSLLSTPYGALQSRYSPLTLVP